MNRFHNLARGIFIDNDSVLLVRAKGADNTFLPGGHIEFGERAEVTLRREIREEIGLDANVGAFLGVIEHSWPSATRENHEFNFLFRFDISNVTSASRIESLEPDLEYIWVKLPDLAEFNLQPSPLIDLLNTSDPFKTSYWASTLHWNS